MSGFVPRKPTVTVTLTVEQAAVLDAIGVFEGKTRPQVVRGLIDALVVASEDDEDVQAMMRARRRHRLDVRAVR